MKAFALLSLAMALVPAVRGVDLKSLKPQGYVSDFAGVVDPQSRAAIEQYAAAVEQSTGVQMSLVTLKTLDGEPLEDVSIDLFKQFGVGQKNKDNGVQLLLVIDDRRSRLEIGNGLEPILPDGLDGQILLDMRPELQAGHYGQAILDAAERVGQTVAQAEGKQIALPAGARPPAHPEHGGRVPWGFVIFIGVVVLSAILRGSRGGRGGGGFWSGLLLGNLLGGGWNRGGGGFGGFGGGGGGGGFGGFGGGSGGGGGASSGW